MKEIKMQHLVAQLSDPRTVVSDAHKTLTAMVIMKDDRCLPLRYQLNLCSLNLNSKSTDEWLSSRMND